MTVQEALQLYKIPYRITETVTGGGMVTHKLSATASTATLTRLKTRLNDLIIETGLDLEIVQNKEGLFIRYKTDSIIYNYFDYNGHIDFDDPTVPFMVGFDNGKLKTDTLDNARHLLVAGTTGSGKSVFLHNLIFTFACNPITELYLVDCKMVEFDIYKGHALIAYDVFGDVSAGSITNYFVAEMEKRYREMQAAGVNDFTEYLKINPQAKRKILIIDELSDLIATKEARKAIIPRLLRIAQKGRAAGFHLIIATQRPDHTVINGTLKGNIPTRIAFKSISSVDSRVILDRAGAERLTGNGDGLYLRNGSLLLERVQAPYLSLDDIRQHESKTA